MSSWEREACSMVGLGAWEGGGGGMRVKKAAASKKVGFKSRGDLRWGMGGAGRGRGACRGGAEATFRGGCGGLRSEERQQHQRRWESTRVRQGWAGRGACRGAS